MHNQEKNLSQQISVLLHNPIPFSIRLSVAVSATTLDLPCFRDGKERTTKITSQWRGFWSGPGEKTKINCGARGTFWNEWSG